MIDAFAPGIPIYVRFNVTDVPTAHYLSISNEGLLVDRVKNSDTFDIATTTEKCFERLIRKKIACPSCYARNMVSGEVADKFKMSAYKFFNSTVGSDMAAATNKAHSPLVITFAYRNPHSHGKRLMTNVDHMITTLTAQFPKPLYDFRPYLTPSVFSSGSFVDEIKLMSETNVLIAEHGAYQSHVS